MRTAKRAKASAELAAVVAALATAAFLLPTTCARPMTATPSILTGPSGTTASATATFSYTDTAPSVSFTCALDGGPFTSCGTGSPTTNGSVTSTDLANGAHAFEVQAQAQGRSVSLPARRAWSVNASAPRVTLAFPAGNGAYNGAGWARGCGGAGLCGGATGPNGVTSVRVAILQQSTGKYWNSGAFGSASLVYQEAAGTTTWSYPLPFTALSDGSYVASMAATDNLGNATPAASPTISGFKIDTTAPPVPAITSQPTNPTSNTRATFHFSDAEAAVSFRCRRDSGALAPCTDGITYGNLPAGDHCFEVSAVDPTGNATTPASSCWGILLHQGSFPVEGRLAEPMVPGVTQPLNLVLTNRNDFAITVTAVTVTVRDATTKNDGGPNPPCVGSQNMTVSRAFNGEVTVPANTTRSLSQLNTPPAQWPLITMPDLPTNQDACKDTTFEFAYSGVAGTR